MFRLIDSGGFNIKKIFILIEKLFSVFKYGNHEGINWRHGQSLEEGFWIEVKIPADNEESWKNYDSISDFKSIKGYQSKYSFLFSTAGIFTCSFDLIVADAIVAEVNPDLIIEVLNQRINNE